MSLSHTNNFPPFVYRQYHIYVQSSLTNVTIYIYLLCLFLLLTVSGHERATRALPVENNIATHYSSKIVVTQKEP